MKNSNKLLLGSFLLLVGFLTAYNLVLRAEFRKGTYKNPLRDFSALNHKAFNQVEINGANELGIKIKQGKFGVWVHDRAADFIQVKQNGPRLIIQVAYPKERTYLGPGDMLLISLPNLKSVTSQATFKVAGKPETPKMYSQQVWPKTTTITGFSQDSLVIHQDNATTIALTGNKLNWLRAKTGTSAGSGSVLNIAPDNIIAAADLNIHHKSRLGLQNIFIPQLSYHFADSATTEISGAALAILKK